MFKGLSGKHAIVTGGSTLIGAGLVEAFVKAGATVTIADIDAERGQAIADKPFWRAPSKCFAHSMKSSKGNAVHARVLCGPVLSGAA